MDSNGNVILDGENEVWYYIEKDEFEQEHISHNIMTIKYYFDDVYDQDGNLKYAWTTDIYQYYIIQGMSDTDAMNLAEITVAEIKHAYAESMKKWNNVYYYTYDECGNKTANKIITVIEGTKEDHNLTIYPITYNSCDYIASAVPKDSLDDNLLEFEDLYHTHYSSYIMKVNVQYFFAHTDWLLNNQLVKEISSAKVDVCRSRTGQHELGHVLGLYDVDKCCTANFGDDHHAEILMGYGNYLLNRSTYAKYKDIAGVSITRGFHTDDDHIWMMRTRANGMKDVICALCNGVRYNVDTSLDSDGNCLYNGKVHNTYQSCVHHGGTNEKMLLVADRKSVV